MRNTKLNYTKQLEVSANAKRVFFALSDKLDLWWGKVRDSTFEANGYFTIQFENSYWWTFKVIEFLPYQEIIWKCFEGEPEFNKEWIGHILHCKIKEINNTKTIINFHQIGLTPDINCYEICTNTWERILVENLKSFLNTEESN
jgi:hypothetical protein